MPFTSPSACASPATSTSTPTVGRASARPVQIVLESRRTLVMGPVVHTEYHCKRPLDIRVLRALTETELPVGPTAGTGMGDFMRRPAAIFSVLLALGGAAPLHAATLNFSFSFTNTEGGGLVTGQVLGLEDNATGAAESVRVTSADFGIGEYVSASDLAPNTFTLSQGEIVDLISNRRDFSIGCRP